MCSLYGFDGVYVYADPDSYEPLARIDGKPGSEEIFYFHTNLVGLPEQLTDEAGLSVWHSVFMYQCLIYGLKGKYGAPPQRR